MQPASLMCENFTSINAVGKSSQLMYYAEVQSHVVWLHADDLIGKFISFPALQTMHR